MQADWLAASQDAGGPSTAESIPLPDGQLVYYPAFYAPTESAALLRQLLDETAWQQDVLQFGGKAVPVPRLQAWYGDPGAHYGYSGLKLTPLSWTPVLQRVRDDLQHRLGLPLNSVLLNWYRDGNDSVAWHADDERELGPDPQIASLSLGATRRFEFKHKHDKALGKRTLDLHDGSLLVMGAGVQRHWLHQIPKQSEVLGNRLNLTFRFIHAVA